MAKSLLIYFIAFWFQETAFNFEGKVVAVIDGDTIEVMRDGKAVRIRLQGVDCPESKQPFGTKAKQFTSDFLYGKQVLVKATGQDRYGRTLADIYIDAANANNEFGAWFNKALVASGMAWHYKQYSKDQELATAEETARRMKVGLWTDAQPVAPWEWRRAN
jgi:endonuclease YncB( thermonuclease family)